MNICIIDTSVLDKKQHIDRRYTYDLRCANCGTTIGGTNAYCALLFTLAHSSTDNQLLTVSLLLPTCPSTYQPSFSILALLEWQGERGTFCKEYISNLTNLPFGKHSSANKSPAKRLGLNYHLVTCRSLAVKGIART